MQRMKTKITTKKNKWFSKTNFRHNIPNFVGKSKKYFGNILNMMKDLQKIGGN